MYRGLSVVKDVAVDWGNIGLGLCVNDK